MLKPSIVYLCLMAFTTASVTFPLHSARAEVSQQEYEACLQNSEQLERDRADIEARNAQTKATYAKEVEKSDELRLGSPEKISNCREAVGKAMVYLTAGILGLVRMILRFSFSSFGDWDDLGPLYGGVDQFCSSLYKVDPPIEPKYETVPEKLACEQPQAKKVREDCPGLPEGETCPTERATNSPSFLAGLAQVKLAGLHAKSARSETDEAREMITNKTQAFQIAPLQSTAAKSQGTLGNTPSPSLTKKTSKVEAPKAAGKSKPGTDAQPSSGFSGFLSSLNPFESTSSKPELPKPDFSPKPADATTSGSAYKAGGQGFSVDTGYEDSAGEEVSMASDGEDLDLSFNKKSEREPAAADAASATSNDDAKGAEEKAKPAALAHGATGAQDSAGDAPQGARTSNLGALDDAEAYLRLIGANESLFKKVEGRYRVKTPAFADTARKP